MRYFKHDAEDLSQLFIPWKDPEYSGVLNDLEVATTRLKHSHIMYQYAWVNFRSGYEVESLTMDELLGAENLALPGAVQVDYEGFEKEVDLKEFRKDVENYVSKLAWNFNSFLTRRLNDATTNFQVQRIFENNLQQLHSSYNNLYSLTKDRRIKKVPKMIAEIHLASYITTYDTLKLSYTDLFDHLLKNYRLGTNEEYNTSDVFRYLETKARILFESFELELIERDYINPKLNLWKRDKKALVLFHIYCRERNMLRPGWKEKNDFLRSLEIRYNKQTGDQGKPGLWKRKPEDYSSRIAKGEFWFLQEIK